LKSQKIPYDFIDFRETPIDQKTIRSWLKYTDIKTLFNTRGTTYRTLNLKALDLKDKDKELWLIKENMLIKRPVITFNNKVIVGYNESEYLENVH
jgi:Spx/MgsR family transcriptional regulator